MLPREWVQVKRDIDVVTVPYGAKMTLPAGSQVMVAQVLGGNFTVVTDQGHMVRVDGSDADAIGQTLAEAAPVAGADPNAPFDEKKVWDQLRTVYDPEIPVNVVDLGLIYDCSVADTFEGGKQVELKMTMTAPGCGMGEVLKQDVERKVAQVPGVKQVKVDIVFDPPWSLDKMSEGARLQLGLM